MGVVSFLALVLARSVAAGSATCWDDSWMVEGTEHETDK